GRRSLVGTRVLRLWDQSQTARSVPRPLHRGGRQEPALAKAGDDRRDAHVLADSLRTDRQAFRRLSNDEPVIVKLREWSRMADDLQQERARLASRATGRRTATISTASAACARLIGASASCPSGWKAPKW